LGTGGPFSG